jgi:DNA-binding transcriptional LysR family regulator
MHKRHLEFALAVAEHANFTRAAEAVHLTQPALSHAIATLEEEFGTPLFDRRGRSVTLTAAGEAFVESARLVLQQLSLLSASVNEVSNLQGGSLELASPSVLAADPLAPLVGEFRSRYPGVQVNIRTSKTVEENERYLRIGLCELTFSYEPANSPLVSEVIKSLEAVAVFPPGTRLKRRRVKRADLAGHALVATSQLEYSGLSHLEIPAAYREPTISVQTDSYHMLVALTLAGAGMTVLPRLLAERAAGNGAVIAEFDPPMRREIYLVRRHAPLSPAAEGFVEIALAAPPRAAPKEGL